jgi:hypothetical protein
MSGIEQPKKLSKTPRPSFTYRQNGGRAFADRRWRAPQDVFKARPYRGPISLNRSQNWPRANSYEHAREISPSAEPVR